MERVIFQIYCKDRNYNKFLLVSKEVKEKVIDEEKGKIEKQIKYKAQEIKANNQVSLEYYNKIFVEGDFDNSMKEMDFEKIIDYIKKVKILKYINSGFKEIEKLL